MYEYPIRSKYGVSRKPVKEINKKCLNIHTYIRRSFDNAKEGRKPYQVLQIVVGLKIGK